MLGEGEHLFLPKGTQRHSNFSGFMCNYIEEGEMDGSGESGNFSYSPRNRNWNFLKNSGSVFFFPFLSFSTFIRLSNPFIVVDLSNTGGGVLWEQHCYSVCVSLPRPQNSRPLYVWSSKKYFLINYILKETVLEDFFLIFWSMLSFSKFFWD